MNILTATGVLIQLLVAMKKAYDSSMTKFRSAMMESGEMFVGEVLGQLKMDKYYVKNLDTQSEVVLYYVTQSTMLNSFDLMQVCTLELLRSQITLMIT